MSDNIDIPVTASGADGVDRLVTALDRLHASMSQLGSNNTGLQALERQMSTMQATMKTGFAELAMLSQKSSTDTIASAERTSKSVLSIEQRRDVELDKLRQQDLASRVSWWNKVLNMQERRDTELNAQAARSAAEYTRWWEKAAAERVSIEQKRDIELHAVRAREHADYAAWWSKTLATDEAAQRKQLELARMQQVALAGIRATEAEKQRTLNTNFLTAGPTAALGTAQKAQVYASQGGNAVEKYGSAAATADIRALQAAHDALQRSTRGSTNGTHAHNDAMREAHSLARGLTGSLGGLWLTYGSLAPLAAGAAISASLKAVVESGRDVEYQLKFVEALGGGNVNLDKFLGITDATVVSVKEAAEGMRALAQNGLNATQSLQALPSVLNLAVIGELSVSNAALSATGTLSAFGMKLQDMDRVGDIFAQAAATSNTSVAAMTESMKQASTVAAVYGGTIEETAAALGVLAKINVTGSAAGTAYTNMLTNLYSPTRQAAAALKELGVETDDGMGGVKNSTQLLGELRTALSRFNEPARADILGDIFTVRGQKAASTIIENLDLYKQKIDEAGNATGYMGRAVAVLEDSTTGAFKRLANSASDSLNRAFASSSPILQELVMHLGEVARSDGTVKLLTAMADATLRVVKTLIDFSGTIGIAVTAMVAFRMIGGITAMLGTYTTAATVATGATQRLAAGMALFNASLGWIALAIGAAVVAWQIFISTTSDVEKADVKLRNSIQANIEYIERETKALEERNKAWNPETQRFDKKIDPVDADAGTTLATNITNRQTDIDRLKGEIALGLQKDNLAMGSTLRLARLEAKQAQDRAAQWKMISSAESLAIEQSLEGQRKEKAGVLDQIEALQKKGEVMKTIGGKDVPLDPQGNETSRAIATSAGDIASKLKANTIDAKQAKIELLALDQAYNASLMGRAKKEKGASESAVLTGRLRDLDTELQLQRQLSEYETASAKRQYARGEIGDLQLINKELTAKADLRRVELSVAERQLALASAADKPGKVAEFEGKKKLSTQQALLDDMAAADKRDTVMARMADETVSYEAKALAEKGQLLKAFTTEYEAKYGETIRRVNADIKLEDDMTRKTQLIGYLAMLAEMDVAGRENAKRRELQQNLGIGLDGIEQKLARLDVDAEGGGIGVMFKNALAAEQALEAAMPNLLNMQQRMQDMADSETDPFLKNLRQGEATKALAQIDDAAGRTRQVWVNAGKVIEKALGDAFGKSGKAAGQMFTAVAAGAAKQKEIQSNLARDIRKDPTKEIELQKKATEDMASAQMRSYSDMAGAAKGFFSEQSRGYAALEAVQRIFRMAEMALSMKSMVMQLFATQTVTAAKSTAVATEQAGVIGSVGTVVAAEGAKSTAYGVTALAAALAAPFPANIPAFAAVAAMLAAIGVVVAGGGAPKEDISVTRSNANGTGSILGDKDAKSESITKALESIEDNTYQGLTISMGMLDALRAIQTSMVGLGSLVTQNYGQGTAFGDMKDSVNSRAPTLGPMFSSPMIGAAMGTLMGGPLGSLLGAAGNWVTSKLFTTKQALADQGLSVSQQSLGSAVTGGVQGSTYADVQTTKKAFGIKYSDKTKRQSSDLSAEIEQQFTQVVKGMRSGVIAAADALGAGGAQFIAQLDGFVISIPEITTKDKTGEEIAEALGNALSKMSDDMARSAFSSLAGFQQAGEGFFETLTRLAQNYQTIDVVFQSFGKTFGAIGLESIAARENLIALSGGLENFISQGTYFLENFFTEEEQAAALRARVQPTLGQYGLNADGTAASEKAFKNYVLALDTTTAAGAEAYAKLMPLAPALKAISEAAEKIVDERKDLQDEFEELIYDEVTLRMKERNALDASNRALYDQVALARDVADARDVLADAYENEKTAIEETVERLEGLAKSWKDFRDGLVLGDTSPLTPQQKYLEARRQFDENLEKAKSGDTDAQDKYESIASAFIEASRTVNASGGSFSDDFEKVLQATQEAETWAKQEVDNAKASLDLLKQQVGGLTEIKDEVLTVTQAINNLANLTMQLNRGAGAGQLDQMIQLLMNRPAGEADRAYWQAKLDQGMSFAQVADAMRQSAEFLLQQASTAADAYSRAMYGELPKNPWDTGAASSADAAAAAAIEKLREDQAQQNSDAIDSYARAAAEAAERTAEAVRDSYNNPAWSDRARAYTR